VNLSAPFVRRPVATVLLTIGIALAGIGAFFVLPVAPLPQVDFPNISVSASLPGASPETMASSVATPLERRLGVIAGVNEMTSRSSSGSTRINLQFDLNRKIDAAAREVQAAISASRVDLPATLRSNPTYRKANPSDAPIMILALTSATLSPGQIYDAVSNVVQQKLAQVQGIGDVELGGGSLPAVRVELLPYALNKYGVSMEDVRAAIQASTANRPKGSIEGDERRLQIYTPGGGRTAADYRSLIVGWRSNAAIRLNDVAEVIDGVENTNTLGLFNGKPAVIVLLRKQPGANVIETVDGIRDLLPELQAQLPPGVDMQIATDSTNSIRASLHSGSGHRGVVAGYFRRDVPAGLFTEQPEPDGTDGGDRFCGRRRHRRARKYRAPYRGRHGPDVGGIARCARGRLYGAVDQRVAGGGVHPVAVHGRPGWPPVPRICGDVVGRRDDLAGHFADHDADDVRVAVACA
jgi:multidrug efflux pump